MRWASQLVGAVLAVSVAVAVGTGTAWAHPVAGSGNEAPARPVLPATPAEFLPGVVQIPTIGLNAPVAPVGTVIAAAPFLGGTPVSTFGVPPDGSSVGWWSEGPMIGGSGMAILLGHTKVGGYAVFNRLGDLRPDDLVSVQDKSGVITLDFRITHVVTGVPKSSPDALQRVLSDNASTSQLALITCGGYFDEGFRASEDNIVAFATGA